MNKTVLYTLILLLTGCISIPLGTMWRMMSFSAEDIATLNPTHIHAAVLVPDAVTVKSAALKLRLSNETGTPPPLESVNTLLVKEQGRFVPVPVPAAEPGWHWYYTDLPAEAEKQFVGFQANYQSLREQYEKMDFSVTVQFDESAAAMPEKFAFTLWLQLQEEEGWFPLFEDAEVTLEKQDDQATGSH